MTANKFERNLFQKAINSLSSLKLSLVIAKSCRPNTELLTCKLASEMPNLAFVALITPLAILIYICNVAGNLLVILVLQVKNKQACKKPNICLLVALAHADLWFTVFLFVDFIVLSLQLSFPLFNTSINAIASIYIYVALAVERYFAILKPFVHMRRATKSLCNTTIFLIYIFSVLLSIPGYFFGPHRRNFNESWKDEKSNATLVRRDWFKTGSSVYSITLFSFGFILPSILIIYCYSCVVYHMWTVDANKATNNSIAKSRRKATRLFILLTVIFTVTWGPSFSGLVRRITSNGRSRESLKFELVSLLLCLVGSTANPAIYFLRCPGYRKDAMKLVTGSCCCKRPKIRPRATGKIIRRANIFPLATGSETPKTVTVSAIRK